MPQVISIVYQPKEHLYSERIAGFIRVPVETAHLIANYGIENDQKGGRHPNRQLNILSWEWLQARDREGYKTRPGEFGEQLVVKGMDFNDLNKGDLLAFGDQAIIEITGPRTGCERLEAAQGRVIPQEIKAEIGLMAKVVQGGTIRLGDSVTQQAVDRIPESSMA